MNVKIDSWNHRCQQRTFIFQSVDQPFEIEKHCSLIGFSPCDVLSGEGTDEPLHIQNLEWGKHQVSWVFHIYSALRIDEPVSGLRTHILLITFCWAHIYPGLTKHDWVKKHVKDHHMKNDYQILMVVGFFSLWRETLLGKEWQQTVKLTKSLATELKVTQFLSLSCLENQVSQKQTNSVISHSLPNDKVMKIYEMSITGSFKVSWVSDHSTSPAAFWTSI